MGKIHRFSKCLGIVLIFGLCCLNSISVLAVGNIRGEPINLPIEGGDEFNYQGPPVAPATAKALLPSETCRAFCAAACVRSDVGDWTCPGAGNKTNPQAPQTPSAEELAQQCINQSQAAIASCTSNKDSAVSTCDVDKSSDLSSAATQATLSAGQITGASVQAACSTMGSVSQGANAGLAAYGANCKSSRTSCTDACSSAKSELDQCAKKSSDPSGVKSAMQDMSDYQAMGSNNTACVALQSKIDQANQAVKNFAQTTANSQNCANATAANDPANDASQAGDPNSAYCQAHPTVATCVLDCTKPSMAGNVTCSYLKNPNPANQTQEKISGISGQGGGSGGSTAGAAGLNLPALDNNAALLNSLTDQASRGHGSDENIGGKTGNGANLGGGGGGGSGGAGARKGVPNLEDKTTVLGGGSGGFYGAGSGGGSSFAASAQGNLGGTPVNGTAGVPKSPDLRKFLPGGAMDPQRTIAGLSGPDGITGPNSNIWQKVQNRYRMMSPSLLP